VILPYGTPDADIPVWYRGAGLSHHPEGLREPALSVVEGDLDSSTPATRRTLFAVAAGQNDRINQRSLMEGTHGRIIP